MLPTVTTSPRLAALIASIVVSLGSKGSNGKALSFAIRTINSRTTSDVVRPIGRRTASASFTVCSSIRAFTTAVIVPIPRASTYTEFGYFSHDSQYIQHTETPPPRPETVPPQGSEPEAGLRHSPAPVALRSHDPAQAGRRARYRPPRLAAWRGKS